MNGILDHFGEDVDISELPEEQRVVLLVSWTQGIIDNGGFNYLFEGNIKGDPHYELTTAAFQAIGCQAAANAFREAMAMFPESTPPMNIDERLRFYRRGDGSQRHKIDCAFWDSRIEIETLLAKYIRSHREAYRQLPMPKVKKGKTKSKRISEPEGSVWTAKLPHWARVVFAVHCARSALPYFTASWPNAPEKRRKALENAIELAEQSAADGLPAKGLKEAKTNATITAGASLQQGQLQLTRCSRKDF